MVYYDIRDNITHDDIINKEWNCYQNYTPELVIDKFNKVFIQ